MIGLTAEETERPPRSERRTGRLLLWIGGAVLAVLIAGLVAFVTIQPVQVLPRMTLAPAFDLRDQVGDRLTSEHQRGKLTLYTFTYTNCGAGCPQTGPAMQAIQERLKTLDAYGVPINLVTIAVDPARDTSERIAAYADEYGADAEVWKIVTGDAERVKRVVGGGFEVYYDATAVQPDGTFPFEPDFVLVDGNGVMRARYRTAALDPETAARHLELVAREVRDSDGPARLAYEAAHLFVCYAD